MEDCLSAQLHEGQSHLKVSENGAPLNECTVFEDVQDGLRQSQDQTFLNDVPSLSNILAQRDDPDCIWQLTLNHSLA